MKRLKQYVSLIFFIALSLLIISFLSCKETEPIVEINEGAAERIIRIEAEGDVLHYQESIFWDEKEFSEIIEDRSEFYDNKVEEFIETYEVDADNFSIEFMEDKNLTLFSCDIYDEFNGNWYDFHWFLNPMELDFLDSPFEKSEMGLSWKGVIGETSTAIILEFPFHINNCHAHVWSE